MRPPLLMAGETLLSCWKKQIGVIMSHLFVYNFKTMYIGIICQSRERSDPYDLVVCFVHIIMRLITPGPSIDLDFFYRSSWARKFEYFTKF